MVCCTLVHVCTAYRASVCFSLPHGNSLCHFASNNPTHTRHESVVETGFVQAGKGPTKTRQAATCAKLCFEFRRSCKGFARSFLRLSKCLRRLADISVFCCLIAAQTAGNSRDCRLAPIFRGYSVFPHFQRACSAVIALEQVS